MNYRFGKTLNLALKARSLWVFILMLVIGLRLVPVVWAAGGAVWTTDASGNQVNQNIYAAKQDVYLNGGPNSSGGGATGLADGNYFVKVTEPNGTLLGSSGSNTVPVVEGVFSLISLYDLTHFADTTNPGGEYKVWVSLDSSFPNNDSKTDNFKVLVSNPTASPTADPTDDPNPSPTASPSATPTESPDPSPTPTEVTPTPTPSPEGTATPVATATPDTGVGGNDGGNNSDQNTQDSSTGQVLGVSTLATTGVAFDQLALLAFTSGVFFLTLGIMRYVYLQR